MRFQTLFRGLSCALVAMLISCGQAAVRPSRIENDQDRLETAYAEADRLVAALITDRALSPFRSIRLDEKHVATDLWIYRLELHVLADQVDTLPCAWVAAVTVWTGGNPLNACLRGSLRLYRRERERIRLVGTTDETPIVRAARSKNGLPDCGLLDTSLSGAVDAITNVARTRDSDGWMVYARYCWAAGCGASGGASVCWLVRGDQILPCEAHYLATPLVIYSSYCEHGGFSVGLRKRTWFIPDPAAVVIDRTECQDPWLEAADLILAAAGGMVTSDRVRGMASRDDINTLARFRVWGKEESCPCEVVKGERDESCQVRVHVTRERPGEEFPEVGWLTLSLGGTAQQPKLESFRFVPDETQPDWEAMK
jgi:hypothetical protein